MAKKNSRFKGSGAYIFAGILLAIVYVANTLLVEGIYWGNQNVSQTTSRTMNSLNSINGQLSEINKISFQGKEYAFEQSCIQSAVQKLKPFKNDGLLPLNN